MVDFQNIKPCYLIFSLLYQPLLGVFLTLNFAQYFNDFVGTLLAIAAGGFIYLASSELIPEMQRETDLKKSIIQFSLFIVGLTFIVILNAVFQE